MNKSLLLIDDDEAIKFIVERYIEKSDLFDSFEYATNGEEAINLLSNRSSDQMPRAILVDINMPVMNGFEFLDQYLKFEKSIQDQIAIAMFSSTENPEDIQRITSIKEVDLFLKKPFKKEYLLKLYELANNKFEKGA